MLRLGDALSLCRVSNLPTVWTNVLAAGVLCGGDFGLGLFLTLSLAMSSLYCAGMCLNDLVDADVDRTQKPFRPLPSGRVSKMGVTTLTVCLFTLGLGILCLLRYRAASWVGLLLVCFIVAYDALHRRHVWSVYLMAACRLLIFLTSSVGVTGAIEGAPAIAGAAQFGYVLLVTVIARHEKSRGKEFTLPVIPLMIAAVSLVDGVVLAIVVSPYWLWAGVAGASLTWVGNRWVRGD